MADSQQSVITDFSTKMGREGCDSFLSFYFFSGTRSEHPELRKAPHFNKPARESVILGSLWGSLVRVLLGMVRGKQEITKKMSRKE